MPKYEDLTGQRFGRLVAIEATDRVIDRRRVWKCQCDCGNIHYTTNHSLKRGDCKSCGCLNKEQITALGKSNSLDITGQKFGKLTAIKKLDEKFNWSQSCVWLCQCDCGNTTKATVSALRSGNITSCGCIHHSQGVEFLKQKLLELNIKYETEKWFNDLKSDNKKPLQFDFYLPDLNILIEFDGEQHYKKNRYFSRRQFKHDCMKNKYSLDKNIPLYRIPYSEKNYIKNINKLSDILLDTFLVKQINHYNIDENLFL